MKLYIKILIMSVKKGDNFLKMPFQNYSSDTKSMSNKGKKKRDINWSSPNLKAFVHLRTLSDSKKTTYRMTDNIYKFYI